MVGLKLKGISSFLNKIDFFSKKGMSSFVKKIDFFTFKKCSHKMSLKKVYRMRRNILDLVSHCKNRVLR